MKRLSYFMGLGAFALFTTCSISSCTDGNDWETDNSVNRLFRVSGISVPDRGTTTAEIKWTASPNTEYYIIEISQEAFTDEIALGANGSLVFGEDKSITSSPYTANGLKSDTEYYIRIKAMSTNTAESRWEYLVDEANSLTTFKTKAEQVALEMTNSDRTSTTLTFRWDTEAAGSNLTRIELLKDEELVTSHNLTSEEISTGSYTFTDLDPNTTYAANLYNNDVRRGYWINAATFPETPAADNIIIWETDNVMNSEYLTTLATEHPNESFTFAFPADAVITIEEKLVIPEGMDVNFFGLPGNSKVKLRLFSTIDYAGAHGSINFQSLEIDGKLDDGTLSGYVMNQTDAAQVETISFDDCVIRNFKTSFFRMQQEPKKSVDNLSINNCIFENLGSGYYFIHIDAKGIGAVNAISIRNSTFNNVCATGKGFIYSKKTNMTGEINLESCTFYKVTGSGQYFIDFDKSGHKPARITIKNCLMGSTGSNDVKGIRADDITPFVENTYATADWTQTGNKVEGYTEFNGTATDLFTDPESGIFNVKDASIQAGDPRWMTE